MDRSSGEANTGYRYGDFPGLFWDAQPDAAIDAHNPVTLSRLLTLGQAEVIGRLVTAEVVEEQLDTLPIPEHVRIFWRAVLRHDPTGVWDASANQERR